MLDVSGPKKMKFLFLFISAFVLVTSSCTRSGNSSSQVTLSLPSPKNTSNKLGALTATTEIPVHIVVNITGSGMSPAYYVWDGHDSTVAPSISLSVPQGPGRLIQVLYVTQDNLRNLNFYYNDVTQDFASANISVAMTVNVIGSSSTQGALVGRYLFGDGLTGPTGVLNTVFQPPGAKPAMIVEKNEVFGGWFQVFALPNQGFSYILEDGQVLLSNFSASAANATDASRALVNLPTHARIDGGNSTPQVENGQNILAGFFGPGAAGKNLCLYPSSGEIIPRLFTDVASGTQITWNTSATAATPCTASQACYVSGGDLTGAGVNCSSPNNISGIKFRELALASKDDLLLFRGPFKLTDTGSGNSSQLTASLSGSTLSIGWAFMPGATVKLDGVEVFYKWISSPTGGGSNNNPAYRTNRGYACNELASKHGFTSGGTYPVNTTSVPSLNVGTQTAGTSLEVIVCPFNSSRAPIHYSSALEWNSGFSGGPAMATKIGLKVIDGTSKAMVGQLACLPLQVVGFDANNFGGFIPNGIQAAFDTTAQGIYLSNDCQTTSTAATTPTPIYNGQIIYYKVTGAPAANISVSMPALSNAGSIVASTNPVSLTIVTAPSVSSVHILTLLPANIPTVQNACYPVNYAGVYQQDANNLIFANGTGSFSPPSVGGLAYFTDFNCSTAASPPLSISGSFPRAFWPLYFKYANPSGSFDIGLVTSGPAPVGTAMVNVVAPGAPASVQMNFFNSIFVGSCLPINAVSVDNNMNPSQLSATGSLSGSSGFSFFSDPTCTSGSTTSLIFSSSTAPSPIVFAKALAPTASAKLSATFTSVYTYPQNVEIKTLPTPTKVNLYADPNPGGSHSLNCQPIMITLEDNNSNAAPATSPVTVTLSGTGINFYTNDGCTGGGSSTFAIGDTAKLMYFKNTNTSGSWSITPANTSGFTNISFGVFTTSPGTSGAANSNFERGASNSNHIKLGICQPYLAYVYNNANNDAIQVSGTVNLTGPGGAPIFSDSACSSTSLANFSSERARIFYIRPVMTGGPFYFSGAIGSQGSGGANPIYVDP